MKKLQNKEYKNLNISPDRTLRNHLYINCEFTNCDFTAYRITNCIFENCIFLCCDFSKSFAALNKRYESGKYIKCNFIDSNFLETSFRFPIIENCEFRNCNLKETNFDGSRFTNAKFIGELDSCFFRGHSIYHNPYNLFPFIRLDLSAFTNKMTNIDFRLCKMTGITFSHGIDLAGCHFPVSEDYLFISDLKRTVQTAKEIIQSDWQKGYQMGTGLKLLELVYYDKNKQTQKNNFIDAHIAKEMMDEDEGTAIRLFNLLKLIESRNIKF